MIAYNIPRRHAQEWQSPIEDAIWISITEPNGDHVQNKFLGALPTLKLKFWDIITPAKIIGTSYKEEPPSERDGRKIVDFLLANKGKRVIANCRAGISRSGAISAFCVDFLGYHWDEDSYQRTYNWGSYNIVLYNHMKNYYFTLFPQEPRRLLTAKEIENLNVS